MKEIKAYIRPDTADRVINALENAGAKGMTIIDVSTLGGWVDPNTTKLSIEFCEKYCSSIKIELVCENADTENYSNIILKHAHTGKKGDGKIFISNIEDAISIRTNKHGIEAI